METQMNNGTETSKLNGMPERKGCDQRLRQLASQAIMREQTKALRRYLTDGLNPNSNFYHGRKDPARGSLIGHAIWIGSFESFKVLLASGAEIGCDEIGTAISCTRHDPRPLQLLLDLGKFDPSGGPNESCSWCDYAEYNSDGDGSAKTVLMKEICEREKAALSSSLPPAKERRARRSL
jgi:hypothetical protein